ncbi:hypothetical protein ERS070004_01079 [Streptococcus pneumoniae]|nr:hypothetical protein ERS070004_01079 [Streptococcus pneumoniae]
MLKEIKRRNRMKNKRLIGIIAALAVLVQDWCASICEPSIP